MKKICLCLCLLALTGCADEGGAYYNGGPPYMESNAGARLPDEGNQGDQYEDVGTNAYVMTSHDPFSTFAADVDTASYDIFVRDVEDSMLPVPTSVRLEEYVNSFDYDYAAPALDDEVPFAINLEAAQHPLRPGIAQVRVGIQAATPPDFVQRPTNLVFLVDTSGSMRGDEKLPLVQEVMRHGLSQLRDNDRVAIVSYAGDTQVRLASTIVGEGRAQILQAINGLRSAGSTNGASGINLAYEQADAGFLEGGFNHVVLMTDGDFNVGITNTDDLVDLIEERRRTGVTLTALGFGRGNLNDAMMERISNSGNGIYSVITSQEHAQRYAEEDLLNTAHFVAQDMKLQVEFNPDLVLAYRLLGYENRAIADQDFRVDTVDAGEVGAGHRVTALYEVVLVNQTIPAPEGAPTIEDGEPVEGEREIAADELIQVRVRWKDLGAAEEDPAYETAAGLSLEEVKDALDPTLSPDFLWASAIAGFAEILKDSPYGDTAHLDRIGEIVAAQSSRDDDRARFARLFAQARALLAR